MKVRRPDQGRGAGAKRKAGEAVRAIGAGAAKQVEGRVDRTAGHTQARVGRAVGNRAMQFKGTMLEARGRVEETQGRIEHDFAKKRAQMENDVSSLRAQLARLKSRAASAKGEAKVNAQAQMAATKVRMEAAKARLKAAITEAREQRKAGIASLPKRSLKPPARPKPGSRRVPA